MFSFDYQASTTLLKSIQSYNVSFIGSGKTIHLRGEGTVEQIAGSLVRIVGNMQITVTQQLDSGISKSI